jgi:carbon storage regulator
MLVLSRKAGEKILIGDKISVTVVRIAPGVVRIGVEAPKEYIIIREELKDNELKGNGQTSPPKESTVG